MDNFNLDYFYSIASVYTLMSAIITIVVFIIFSVIIKTVFTTIRVNIINNFFKKNVIIKSVSSNDNINSKNGNHKAVKNYYDVHNHELSKFNIDDINTLKDYFYNQFIQFEFAYNNLDLGELKLLSTKEMFYNYQTGINLNLSTGKKRVIKDIERKNVIIFELDSTKLKQVASVMIEISYINYTINKKGYVIRGNKNVKITEKFEVCFRKDFEREVIQKCPNCGASLKGNTCEYCRTLINDVEFKISSIKKIID